MVTKHHLVAADYVVIGISLLIASGIGIWFRLTGNRQNTTNEYLMAGKDMSQIPVILSTTVTMMSAVTLIGAPAEVYRYGFSKVFQSVATLLGTVLAAYVFIPVYFKCGVSTVYEFLEMRYGKKLRYTVSAIFVIQMVFYMAISLYGPVLALSSVTDMSPELSIIIIGLVCTFYCMVGGLRAVMWTDVFQAILMFVFVILLFSKGVTEAGGVEEIFRKASEGKRLDIWNFSSDMTLRYTVWSSLARGIMIGLAYYGTSQVEVQRMLSMRITERARSSLVWSAIPSFILNCMCCFSGLIMYGIFHSCDPIMDGIHTGVKKYDQVVPYYVVTRFSSMPGITGLCVSGIFSGSLSTISSVINSVSTVTVKDFITPLLPSSQMTEKRTLLLAKFLSFVYGMICIGLTFSLSKTDSLVRAGNTLLGIMEGPMLAVFLIAVLTRKGTERCALIGLLFGVTVSSWIGYGSLLSGYRHQPLPLSTSGCQSQTNSLNALQNFTSLCLNNSTCLSTSTPPVQSTSETFILYKISYTWVPAIGCCVSICVTCLSILSTGCKNAIPAGSKCLSPITRLWNKQKPSGEKNHSEHTNGIPLEEKFRKI